MALTKGTLILLLVLVGVAQGIKKLILQALALIQLFCELWKPNKHQIHKITNAFLKTMSVVRSAKTSFIKNLLFSFSIYLDVKKRKIAPRICIFFKIPIMPPPHRRGVCNTPLHKQTLRFR